MSGGFYIDVPFAAKAHEKELADIYTDARLLLYKAEALAANPEFSEDHAKRLDKSMVLMKLGCKLIKKVLQQRGFKNLKPPMKDAA